MRDVFTCPIDELDFDTIRAFLTAAIAERLQAESLVLEFKRQNDGNNVIHAVAAMANTDGGMVVVGIDEKGDDPFVGINRERHDSIVRSLRAHVPDAMPEVIPVAIPGTDKMLLLLRVDADAAIHPVVVDGRVMKRVPGQSVGARRDEVVALCARPTSATPMALAGTRSGLPDISLWKDVPGSASAPPTEVRTRAAILLPKRLRTRGYIGSAAIASATQALSASPLPGLVLGEQTAPSSPLRPVHWECAGSTSVRADFTSQHSTAGVPWRPQFSAVGRIVLREGLLDTTLSAAATSKDDDPPIIKIEELHDILLASLHSTIAAGRAAATAMGAERPMQPPIVDGAVRGIFNEALLTLGPTQARRPEEASRPEWWVLPSRPGESTDVISLDALVKEWLHIPLFEFGMLGFEDALTELPLPRWTRTLTSGPTTTAP